MNLLTEQYRWIEQTRDRLLNYLDALPTSVYVTQLTDFGWGSIRNLQVHVANCYFFWLGAYAGDQSLRDIPNHAIHNVPEARRLYDDVDTLVHSFLERSSARVHDPVQCQIVNPPPSVPPHASPLWLWTHAVTHEFHHKGQIVSMARRLGSVPPDTDLVCPWDNS